MIELDIRIEWLAASEVRTPELAATWARYEIWVDGRCATQVEDGDGTPRRSVYGALYPLAEWVAMNWWLLNHDLRPSAVDARYWNWPNVGTQMWLAAHNLRGAGNGMAWPNLTIVPEGAVTRLRWTPDFRAMSRVRFLSGGDAWLASDSIREALSGLVDRVLERLAEQGLGKTPLAEEWESISRASTEEREFLRTVARLGIDPYSLDNDTERAIFRVARTLPTALQHDFFDTADPHNLDAAAEWTTRALMAAESTAVRTKRSITRLQQVVDRSMRTDRPWLAGYDLADRVRGLVGTTRTDRFDIAPWVATTTLDGASLGVQGAVAVAAERCGVVLGSSQRSSPQTVAFGRARALGRALARPQEHSFVLTATRTEDEKIARAFAAELLAPAEGIRAMLTAIGKQDDAALEAIAKQYGVSPLLVRHQYENQIAEQWGPDF